MKRFIQSHIARKAAEATSRASATGVGSVPVASAANSAGASTNAAEISLTLDHLLNHLSDGERLSISEENVAVRLQKLCDTYPESHVPRDVEAWQCNEDTLTMMRLAADCAEAIYKHADGVTIPGVTLNDEDYTELCSMGASQSGAYKATALRVHSGSGTLVVAIRGTKKTSPIDWITNANGTPEDVAEFLPGTPNVKAHSGFLHAARGMCGSIISAVKRCETDLTKVVLTGHSAGGAVAALIFVRLKLASALDIPIHCITFGAPPVISPGGIERTLSALRPDHDVSESVFLAFAAHGDLVVRADRPYVRKIIEIYSSTNVASATVPGLQFETPELYNAGKLVLLFDQNTDGDEYDIKAVEVEDAIGTLLWGNVRAHSMKWYCEMIAHLSDANQV